MTASRCEDTSRAERTVTNHYKFTFKRQIYADVACAWRALEYFFYIKWAQFY